MSAYKSAPAFKAFGQTLSYGDLDRLSRNFAAYLQGELGVKKGDRVAVMLPNIVAFPIAMLGIFRTGAIQVNVNPLYTARELEHQLKDSGAEHIVVFSSSTATLGEVMDSTSLKSVITVDPGDGLGIVLLGTSVDSKLIPTCSFTHALQKGAYLPLATVQSGADDVLILQYTGGTTGLSKGAALSHRNLLANVAQYKALMANSLVPGEEVVVTAIPLYHIFALMVSVTYFSIGAENWLIANPRDGDGLVSAMAQARPSVFAGVNTLYSGLIEHPHLGEVDWSRLKLSIGGGAAIARATSEKWAAITGRFISEGYGLSETSSMISLNPDYIPEFTGTSGLPGPSTDVVLLDEDGREVPVGESGEICVRGPQVMAGYWQQPTANAAAFTGDGYFRTGDIGVFDEHGFLKIVDRKKDMILVSGFNVYPNEVEEVAMHCDGVLECACVGIPDARKGEAVRLFVVKRTGNDLTEAELLEHCRTHLAGYKVPQSIRFMDALPKSTVGKILRRELKGVA